MAFVITSGDEGVQINEGTRLAFAGGGFKLEGFGEAVKILRKYLGDDLRIAASEEDAWIKEKLDLANWEQVNASAQQHLQVLADQQGLLYAGNIPFADPQELDHGIRGHMVRPQGMHLATKIAFTLGGGEQAYHLGHFLISADWVGDADEAVVRKVLEPQIAHYAGLAGKESLPFEFEEEGALPDDMKERNRKMLKKVGILK
jgi:hypothetical protein